MTDHAFHQRVLAIDPTSRGFGFAILEGRADLVEWGVKEARSGKYQYCIRHVAGLLKRYGPQILVVEDLERSRRHFNVKDRVTAFVEQARADGMTAVFVTQQQVHNLFAPRGAKTRSEIARLIAQDFPELKHRLPPTRRLGMNEDVRIRMFGAVAMAQVYYQRKRNSRRF